MSGLYQKPEEVTRQTDKIMGNILDMFFRTIEWGKLTVYGHLRPETGGPMPGVHIRSPSEYSS